MSEHAANGAEGDAGAPDRPARFRTEPGEPYVVHVAGDLDADTGLDLQRLLDAAFDASPSVVVVDVAELEFVDSMGLSVLVTAHNRGATTGVAFEIHHLPANCRRVFEITNLVDVLDLR
jgi:anti-anti-sigma factor